MSAYVESAEAVLVLPGLICDGSMFTETLRAFPTAHAIDDHYGGADRIGDMASHVLGLAPSRFALIGHSMGARVALEIVARAPEQVSRLMLANTGVHGVAPGEQAKRHALRDLGRKQGFDRLLDAWLPPMVGAPRREDAALIAMLRAMCSRAGQRIFEAQIEALLHRPDARAAAAEVRCPTMIVVGDEDQWSPVAQHREMAQCIVGSQLHVIDRAGHMAPAEQPAQFNRLIAAWLKFP